MPELLSKCTVCQALLDEEDLFCSNCGTEAPQRQARPVSVVGTSLHGFDCTGCGASMSFSAAEGSLACPFCGSTQVVESQQSCPLVAAGVVPFVVGQEQAARRLREWLGQSWWRPGDLLQQAAVVSMKAVYLPFWVFSGKTHTYWTADTNQTPAGARGDWFPLAGEHHGQHEGILVGASGALAAAETAEICPFDLAARISPERADFSQATVEQFASPRKMARPVARHLMEERERQTCDLHYIPGRSRNVKVNVLVREMTSEPILLPVWIMAYRYRDELFRFLVNGQTGQATGRAPLSWWKIGGCVAAAAAVLVLFLTLFAQ